MPIDVLMPALSPTMEEGGLAKWLVKAGDKVKSGDVIAEIETDKATMEVEAVDEGTCRSHPGGRGGPGGDGSTRPSCGPSGERPRPPRRRPRSGGLGAAREPPPKGGGQKLQTCAKLPPGTPTLLRRRPAAPRRYDRTEAACPCLSPGQADCAEQKGLGSCGPGAARACTGGSSRPTWMAPDRDRPRPKPGRRNRPASAVTHAPRPGPVAWSRWALPPGSYDLIPLDGMRRTVARRMTESVRRTCRTSR